MSSSAALRPSPPRCAFAQAAGASVARALGGAALLALGLSAPPLRAQDAPPPDPGRILEDFARSAREALDALSGLASPWAEALGPVLADPGAYDPPVVLPNGDVLIRRKTPAPPPAPGADPDAPALDL